MLYRYCDIFRFIAGHLFSIVVFVDQIFMFHYMLLQLYESAVHYFYILTGFFS